MGETSNLGLGSPNGIHATFDAGVGRSYELDVVGRIRCTIEAAQADAEAQAAAYDLARTTVVAGVVGAYGDAAAGARTTVARHSVELQRQSFPHGKKRSRWPLHVARRYPLIRASGSARGSAAADRGKPQSCTMQPCRAARPDARRLSAGPRDLPDHPFRRPPPADCRRYGADPAPARSVGALVDVSALRLSFGPLISWSFPNRRVAKARIAESDAAARATLATFDGSVLAALRETETVLSTYARDLDQNAKLRVARDESGRASALQARMTRGGLGTGLELLDTQRSLATTEAALAASDASIASDRVRLFLALGVDWEGGMAGP
jgi:outer membrane protein TolC